MFKSIFRGCEAGSSFCTQLSSVAAAARPKSRGRKGIMNAPTGTRNAVDALDGAVDRRARPPVRESQRFAHSAASCSTFLAAFLVFVSILIGAAPPASAQVGAPGPGAPGHVKTHPGKARRHVKPGPVDPGPGRAGPVR